MTESKITIIVPTYNRANFIGESLESALRQDLPPAEIIVVDDGSTDDTEQAVSRFGSRIVYVAKPNGGKSSAINLGLALAEGDHILVLDDDDLLPPSALRAHAEALARTPTASFSYGPFARFRGPGKDACNSQDVEQIPVADDRRLCVKLMENCFLTNPTWMVRAAAQRAVGDYDESLIRGQDFDMILRLSRASRGARVDQLVLYQRKHLAMRGSQADGAMTEDTVDRWMASDRRSFEGYDSSWDTHDFRPWNKSPDDAPLERLSLLQRAVILFIRKVYDRSARHFVEYRTQLGDEPPQPSELRVCRNLLGSRYGIDDLVGGGQPVSDWLRELGFPAPMRRAFATHLRWRIRNAVREGRVAEARKLAKFARRAFGAPATLMALAGRQGPAHGVRPTGAASDRPLIND